jgi:uncharacterized protein (UPF0305 family)
MKISAKEHKKETARKLYIAGITIAEISQMLKVGGRTIQSYRIEDCNGANDWDSLKAARLMGKDPEERAKLLDNFVEMMRRSVAEINADETMRPKDKADALASLGDAYSKMLKVARSEDPEAYKINIIRKTLFITLGYLNKKLEKSAMEKVLEVIDSAEYKEALADV